MKKFIVLILSFFFGLGCVNAYTTGSAYGKLNFTNNFWNEYVACGYTGYCSKNITIDTNQRPTITCDTGQCFISFTSFATLQQTSPTQTISYFVQVKQTNGTWLPCETNGGTSTCMVPKNTTLTDLEIKFMQYSNTLNVNIDMNTILIFNSPSDTEQQLNNIQQQQQQQLQFIQDNNTSGANTGYGGVFNESVADTTGTTALFSVLQNFITNLSTNDSCSSFSIPIPFLNSQNVVLPCMRSVYTQHFGLIYNLVQIILSAIIFYWCVVNVLKLFKETLDPFNYKLEVLDL